MCICVYIYIYICIHNICVYIYIYIYFCVCLTSRVPVRWAQAVVSGEVLPVPVKTQLLWGERSSARQTFRAPNEGPESSRSYYVIWESPSLGHARQK